MANSPEAVRDPQLQARGHFVTVAHPTRGPGVVEGARFRLSRTPARVDAPAPTFGDSSQWVLETALGYAIHHTFSSDYRTVSTALNSGVPLTLANHSEISEQFGAFTRNMVGIKAEAVETALTKRAKFLGIL